MSVRCQTVTSLIEKFAPKNLAEDWDSIGLQVGNPAQEITGVLVTLDVNHDVLSEALLLGANLIVSHHPVIFKPLKNLRLDLPQGQMMAELIKNDIAVYCAHTNLDSAREGVNQVLAELLELQDIQVLNADKSEKLFKIVVFIPESHTNAVREAMTKAGAGWIGNYSDCTFSVQGMGTFKASEGCNPFLGEIGVLEKAAEVRLETIVRENHLNKVIRSMIQAHPYEEVAYDIYQLANAGTGYGLGRIGRLPQKVKLAQFMEKVKKALCVNALRFGGDTEADVEKVALCGGSGSKFIHKASFAGADVFLTGDVKYHEAQQALELGLNFVDAGHFATEIPVVGKLAQWLRDALIQDGLSLPVHISRTNCDVISYF